MKITLKKITEQNRQECFSLKVNPAQSKYIASNMIDKSLQGKGYGHLALKEIIQYFKDNGADIITLSTKPSNKTALSLYHQFDFKENGKMNDEEIILKLYL